MRLGPGALALLFVAGIGAVGFSLRAFATHHYDRGYSARSAETDAALAQAQAKIDSLATQARNVARDLEEAEALTASLFEELADEADRDPDGIRLSAESVRRLNAVAGGAADPVAP
ncbi:hypothetical protein [Roseicyclus marinus]|uniref:hypothetical protein n=1 Tax=Roseicyclus marinus TaxID=2161673 RepID=UPI00240FA6F9|nr:hypothetical protein [Roseicyclus marinus]MDG3040425.1 hypothetical protein [Roseicyclus marinus]